MTTVVINDSSPQGRLLVNILRMTKKASGTVVSIEEESPYDPVMVEKVKRGEREVRDGKGVKIDLDDLWK
jgi:hypothetical protein